MEPLRNLPSGKTTRSATVYVREWKKLGNKVVKFFPGYTVTAYDCGVTLFKYEKNRFNELVVVDKLNMNMLAIQALLSTELPSWL